MLFFFMVMQRGSTRRGYRSRSPQIRCRFLSEMDGSVFRPPNSRRAMVRDATRTANSQYLHALQAVERGEVFRTYSTLTR
jgi:hypothetical protein